MPIPGLVFPKGCFFEMLTVLQTYDGKISTCPSPDLLQKNMSQTRVLQQTSDSVYSPPCQQQKDAVHRPLQTQIHFHSRTLLSITPSSPSSSSSTPLLLPFHHLHSSSRLSRPPFHPLDLQILDAHHLPKQNHLHAFRPTLFTVGEDRGLRCEMQACGVERGKIQSC